MLFFSKEFGYLSIRIEETYQDGFDVYKATVCHPHCRGLRLAEYAIIRPYRHHSTTNTEWRRRVKQSKRQLMAKAVVRAVRNYKKLEKIVGTMKRRE